MKILVTGGTGFTGSHLAKRLASHGHEVIAMDNQKGIAWGELEKAGVRITIGSVTDTALMQNLIQGCDVIFHLAAAFRRVNLPKRVYWQTNVDAMRSLLQAAQDAGVRKVVYCSTQGVHGNVDNPPGDENSPIKPEDYYQFTKYEGETVAQEFMQRGMDITILRPTAIYGPGDPGRFLMMYKRVASGSFPFFGSGQALYHPLYIDNFIDAFELAMTSPKAKGQTYIIADERYYTIREIVEEIAQVMGTKIRIHHYPFSLLYLLSFMVEIAFKPFPWWDPPLFRRRADWFRQNRAFRIEKARLELGYSPKVNLTTGLRLTLDWYRANGYLREK